MLQTLAQVFRSRTRRWRLTGLITVLGITACLLAVSGCGSASRSGNVQSQGSASSSRTVQSQASNATVREVTWAFPGSTDGDPFSEVSGNYIADDAVMSNIEQHLVAFTPTGALFNQLASSAREVSPTVYVYKIRRGVHFSDGHPLTVADVLFSLDQESNPKTTAGLSAILYASVKSITQDGPDGVKVTLIHPDPSWSYSLADFLGGIYEKANAVRNHSTPGAQRGIPIGTGPYKVTAVKADGLTMVRNPYYSGPGPQPTVQTFNVRYIPDDATRLAAMQSGAIDGTMEVSALTLPEWQAIPSINMLSIPSFNDIEAIFNTRVAPFNDEHVRQAMMYAFNRAALVQHLLHGAGSVAHEIARYWDGDGMSAAQVTALESAGKLGPQYPYDMAKAKAALAASRYPHGFTATVIYTPELAEVADGLQVWASDVAPLHIHLILREESDGQAFGQAFAYHFQLWAAEGGAEIPEEAHGMQEELEQGNWPTAYNNPRVNGLIIAALDATNPTKRLNFIEAAQTILNDQLPIPKLWWDNQNIAITKKLVLLDPGRYDLYPAAWMAYVRAAKQ